MMKRMTILLTAATLALVPLTSNAKKPAEYSKYGDIPMQPCSCTTTELPEYTDEEGNPWTDVVRFNCSVSWDDVIGAGTTEPDKAAYGASFEVEVLDEEGGEAQVLYSEMDLDWRKICTGGESEGTCEVGVEDAPFILTNLASQDVEVEARVKAFETGRDGKTPRNFIKSFVACDVDAPPSPAAE